MQFIDVLIRQAHPGPDARPYTTMGEKLVDARRHQTEERIPYPVLADDLEGTVHRMYGGLADPSYLIGADGRISFYCMWTHAPTLHRAIETLLQSDASGAVLGGWDRRPHVLPALTDGWKGLRRGFPQSVIDLEVALPGTGTGPFVGHVMRGALAPVALRSTPLPVAARVGLAAAGATLAWAAWKTITTKDRVKEEF